MKAFMDDNFLLESEIACILYHDYAEKMPVIDYHCHINPSEIADDRKYENITQVWLELKHRKCGASAVQRLCFGGRTGGAYLRCANQFGGGWHRLGESGG